MTKPNFKELCKVLVENAARGARGMGAPDRVPYAKVTTIVGRKLSALERTSLKREWESAVDRWYSTNYPPPK